MNALALVQFLAEHLDLIEEIGMALLAGAPKDAIKLAIKEAAKKGVEAASDAAMRAELADP